MKIRRSPSDWFLLGALLTSEPWSWFLGPPEGLAHSLLHSVVQVWILTFFGISFFGVFGYAAGLAVFRSCPPRRLSVGIGAAFGLVVVAATRLPQFADANFGPLAIAAVVASLLTGLVVGFRERRAKNSFKAISDKKPSSAA